MSNDYAKGSKSLLLWHDEETFGVAPVYNASGAGSALYESLVMTSETFAETIEEVRSEDIRRDKRAATAPRGGNIAVAGSFTSDFRGDYPYGASGAYSVRDFHFMQHLLGDHDDVPTPQLISSVADLAASTEYEYGDFVESNGRVYMCISPTASNSYESVSGGITFATGTGTAFLRDWIHVGKEFSLYANSTAYARGDYIWVDIASPSFEAVYVCTRGGTTNSATPPTHTAGREDAGGLEWEYVGADITPALYYHFIKGENDLSSSLSFIKHIKNTAGDVLGIRFNGCRINSMDLTIPQRGMVRTTYNVLGMDADKLTTYPSATTELAVVSFADPLMGYDCMMCLGDFTAANTDEFRPCQDISVNITNNIDENSYIIGYRYRDFLLEGNLAASGRFTMFFKDTTEYDYYKGESQMAMNLSMIHAGTHIRLNFPETRMSGDATPKISGSGVLLSEFTWSAFAQQSLNSTVNVFIVNSNSAKITNPTDWTA